MLRLRHADITDVSDILTLIRELAEYERLADQVVATEERLRDTLFGTRRYAHVILAEWEGALAGQALYFFNYSTFHARPGIYLEDLFVRPSFRGRGIGTALLRRLAQVAIDHRCARVDWAVLDWNAPSVAFYERVGAVAMADWRIYRLTGDALSALAGQTGRLTNGAARP